MESKTVQFTFGKPIAGVKNENRHHFGHYLRIIWVMEQFNDEPGWQVICIRCTNPFVVTTKYMPRNGDPYICPGCREIVDDEFEPEKPENGDMG